MSGWAALLAGLVFGLGLTLSGMTNPDKVLAFLTLSEHWDPTLIAVLASAVSVTAIGYALVGRLPAPLFDSRFHAPTERGIDARLVAGAVIFGVGWGIAGYCPGPAIVGALTLDPRAAVFLAAMLVGAVGFRFVDRRLQAGSA